MVIALALLTGACSGSSTTNPTTGTTSNKTMTAVITGTAWTAVTVSATRSGNVINISGGDTSNPVRSIDLSIIGASTGTYTMASGASNALLTIAPETWSANVLGGSGSITLTSLSTTGASGTFTFTAVPENAAASGSRRSRRVPSP